jgi:hypothetical protein
MQNFIKPYLTVEQVRTVEFFKKTPEAEEECVRYPLVHEGTKPIELYTKLNIKDSKWKTGFEILNPYDQGLKCNDGTYIPMTMFDSLFDSLCAIEDGYGDCLVGSNGMFGNFTHHVASFVDPIESKEAKEEFKKNDFYKLFPINRADLFYLLQLGAGFGHCWYADPDPTDKFAIKYPDDPYSKRTSKIYKAKIFKSEAEAEAAYQTIVDYDTKEEAKEKANGRDIEHIEKYAQGRSFVVMNKQIFDYVSDLEILSDKALKVKSKYWSIFLSVNDNIKVNNIPTEKMPKEDWDLLTEAYGENWFYEAYERHYDDPEIAMYCKRPPYAIVSKK